MGVDRQSPPSPELKVFSDRLQKAMEFKKIDVAVLAKNLEYKPGDIHKMLAGMREPSLKKLMLLANSLGCSVDFLLGLTPEAKRASVVVEVDMDAKKPQLSERGQTSGQISGKVERFIAMMPELLESDVELLMYLAGFLIDRKGKMLAKIMGAVAEKPPKEAESLPQISHSKNNDDLSDGDFDEEDDLWEDIEDDEFEDDDFEEDDFEDEDDDFDEDDFEDE